MRKLLAAFGLLLLWPTALVAQPVHALKITVLSTMLSDDNIGEWGYAALVEVDGKRILFDTGARPDTVLNNARELHIDLSTVEDVVLSHNHDDHTGGLLTLRNAMRATNPLAFSRVHVAAHFFDPWKGKQPPIFDDRATYEASGGRFIVHDKPDELEPGVWLTGPVPRHTDEHNYGADIVAEGAPAPDVPEDQSLVVETTDGPVILTGCGHAGIVNIIDDAEKITHATKILAIVGGLHLYEADEARLAWTAAAFEKAGVRYLLAGHCTGIEATMRLRALAHLTRATAAYGGVASGFTLGKGIDPGEIGG
jgi:7,8-dihydropterin-6-yl-methyl-4-(beta-D-ribofuranosyl)aminobenzene 5'-phosphate synthase